MKAIEIHDQHKTYDFESEIERMSNIAFCSYGLNEIYLGDWNGLILEKRHECLQKLPIDEALVYVLNHEYMHYILNNFVGKETAQHVHKLKRTTWEEINEWCPYII